MTGDVDSRSVKTPKLVGDMALWPRVRQAIYATALSRADVQWRFPECHKKNCSADHGDVDFVVRMVLDGVADSVLKELLCRAVTQPDDGEPIQAKAIAGES
ncbi:hypothetical protein BST43_21545 [Mycobacteroides saopaulense]|uniref:Uncharacterized protein n=1 Tax=Mycobacteroides saopaulense TaxID=1578165 RepID=A0A1X0IQP5_9MYCO|nr:hypothetical protein [Mycobacteroides saopaulense]ORB50757.1 hypothetical protein BST43_21545 [Mycobacteroides saopaulense]